MWPLTGRAEEFRIIEAAISDQDMSGIVGCGAVVRRISWMRNTLGRWHIVGAEPFPRGVPHTCHRVRRTQEVE